MLFLLNDIQPLDWFMIIAWGIVFVVTLIIELETADLTTIWFCISSIIALICGIMFAPPMWQIVIFIVSSGILILATKPLVKKFTKNERIRTNADRVIGMTGMVTKAIVPGEIGEVKVDNNLWRAVNNEGLSFAVGEAVSIDAISGIKLVVSKLNGNSHIQIL